MSVKKIGFIGCGTMAQAMIKGMLHTQFISNGQLIVSSKTAETAEKVQSTFQIETTLHNKVVAKTVDILFLAVKPHLYGEVLQEIKDVIKEQTIVVSIAAGVDIAYMENQLSKQTKIIRSMPNTPSLVGEGMTVFCSNAVVSMEEVDYVTRLFSSFGKVEIVSESLMDYIPAISGSSPAYVYMFIEALAMGGVQSGIPREKAYRMSAQSVLGAAKMVLETGKHPSILRDEVCTPGGTTIEAIASLEQHQFRGTVLAAMESCTQKNKAMQKK